MTFKIIYDDTTKTIRLRDILIKPNPWDLIHPGLQPKNVTMIVLNILNPIFLNNIYIYVICIRSSLTRKNIN